MAHAARELSPLALDDIRAHTRMLRYPDVSATQIVFTYANDLWLVPREGGVAVPLTRPPGIKGLPRFSPDGQTIAFIGNYDGNYSLYSLPAKGGTLTRLTYFPSGMVYSIGMDYSMPFDLLPHGWTPDGNHLLTVWGFFPIWVQCQLFTVPRNGGLPVRLPVPYGIGGAISPDGQWLAYTLYPPTFTSQKRYQGGRAPRIWLFNLRSHQSQMITGWQGTDTSPMWHGAMLYFLSDAGPEQRLNIWSYDLQNGRRQQITHFRDYDVKWPSIGPGPAGQGEIVFQYGADLHLLDLRTHDTHVVKVLIPGDHPALRPRDVDASKFITAARLSPTGKRVVLEARGDIWTVPAESGSPRNLTRSSGVAERDPAWSPDARWIAYFSDATGEYELYTRPAGGGGKEEQLTRLGPGFRYRPTWSPDSRRIAFVDTTGAIYLYTLADHTTKHIDTDPLVGSGAERPQLSWSPDSSWLAYAKGGEHGFGSIWMSAIWLYNVETGQRHQVTTGRFHDTWPTFDRKGDYLFFISVRDFSSPTYDSIGDRSWIYTSADALLAAPLRRDVAAPWAPRSDEETPREPSAPSTGREQPGAAEGAKKPLVIDVEGLEDRAIQLPAPKGRLSHLAVTHEGKVIYTLTTPEGESSIRILDLADQERESRIVAAGTDDFQLSADGKKLLVRKDQALAIVDAAPDQKLDHPVSLTGMTTTIDPRAEWRQIFTDAWRLYRDFFYDPHMHRVDWPGIRERYAPLLEACACRDDVNYVISEMIGELSASHAWVWNAGDVERPPVVSVGMLGADFELHEGAYRIARIYTRAPYDVDGRTPLHEPGVDVKEGDYLLAVNRVPIDTNKDPWAAFRGLAGRSVTLTVSHKPAMDQEAREVVVRTLEWDRPLRYRAWVEDNRAYVERHSGGRVGYIYLPNTGSDGAAELSRGFYSQMDKEAIIVDARWNTGGPGPDRLIEMLQRPIYFHKFMRHSVELHDPEFSLQGPKCMLVNGMSVSAGDALPDFFRKAGLGKIVGTRTSGALLAITSKPSFIDGGSVWVPGWGIYNPDGRWTIEGHGVDPDIEVIDDPAKMVDGGDPQLNAAIQLMLAELKRRPYVAPTRPAYRDRRDIGVGRAEGKASP